MAFKKMLAQRLFSLSSRISNPALIKNCRISSPCSAAKSASLNRAPDPGDDGIFRRYLHRSTSSSSSSDVRFLPTGEKLLEKLREMDIARERIRFDGLIAPAPAPEGELTVSDAKKILRLSRIETVKAKLRLIEKDSVSYAEYLEICAKECESVDLGFEIGKMLDQSGCVIVLGNIVFLRPEKVMKAIQGLIPAVPSPHNTDDQRTKELQGMEKAKAAIDKKAEFLVNRELWGGLAYLLVQTAAFMRLTFWELSWDVMEPICFYVTSIYFMGGYAFFLRTSKEPSFEGFYQSRFSTKQKRLMKARNFDLERYNELRRECCHQPPVNGGAVRV